MATTETLTSLAMLKVNIDQGKDYLEYLKPFVLQVLADNVPDPVTDEVVHDYLRTQFGLEIPSRTVQVVLRRLSQARLLKREDGAYHIVGVIPDPNIGLKKSEANRHIQAVVSGLLEYGKSGSRCLASEDEAVAAICEFLSDFDVSCLRAYLRGTTIPTVQGKQQVHKVLVSNYVLDLQQQDPERFESFMILVQGHMLANALLCPDLQNAPKSYKGVTFYLDTPLLVQWLGLEGEPKKRAVEELIKLLRNLGGAVATFSHSREELDHVLRGAAEHIESQEGRGAIIFEARRSGRTKSDVLLMAGQIDQLLADAGIAVTPTPRHTEDFQIDEKAFEKVLEDEINYYNPRARDYDINSVRSIYALRGKTAPTCVEKAKAMLVSSNAGFARAAYDYGRQHDASSQTSSVISDFSLANTAWLKAPMGASSLPRTELLAYSYAALRPSKELLDRYLTEMDKLQKQGKLSVRDHQLLRSSIIGQEELVQLTLGDETALTEETISETLRRVTEEIQQEAGEKAKREQDLRRATQEKLDNVSLQRDLLQKRIYWRCRHIAQLCACAVSAVLFILLVGGIAVGLGLRTRNPWFGWVLSLGSALIALGSLANLLVGTTVKQCHESIQTKCLTYLLRKESRATGIDLGANE